MAAPLVRAKSVPAFYPVTVAFSKMSSAQAAAFLMGVGISHVFAEVTNGGR